MLWVLIKVSFLLQGIFWVLILSGPSVKHLREVLRYAKCLCSQGGPFLGQGPFPPELFLLFLGELSILGAPALHCKACFSCPSWEAGPLHNQKQAPLSLTLLSHPLILPSLQGCLLSGWGSIQCGHCLWCWFPGIWEENTTWMQVRGRGITDGTDTLIFPLRMTPPELLSEL